MKSSKKSDYWTFRDELAMIEGVVMKGKRVITLVELQPQVLGQLHNNHIGISKARLLARESVYWINMNADIENAVKNCLTHWIWHMQPNEKKKAHVMVNNNFLCVVDYHSKLLIARQAEKLLADS